MRFFSRMTFLLLWSLFTGGILYAQNPSRKELEKRRSNLLHKIAETQKQLSSTQESHRSKMSQLRAINSNLRKRKRLISTINSEMGHINGDIASLQSQIKALNKNLHTLKMKYAESVRYAYKHRISQNLILFLFSSNSFNDAIRRMRYLKRYRDYRTKQANEIRKSKQRIHDKIVVLNDKKEEKKKLLNSSEKQRAEIKKEKAKTDKIVNELKGKENNLMAEIRKNKRTSQRIQAAIKAEIQKEIEAARKREEEKRKRLAAQKAKQEAQKKAAKEKAEAAARQRAVQSGNVYSSGGQTVTLNTGSSGNTSTNKSSKSSDENKTNKNAPPPKPSKPSYTLSLTPEVQALSKSFAANEGKLPWPVAHGNISQPYGRHPHPVYHSVEVVNNGIDITTYPRAAVRAVFSGKVIKVVKISGYVVMISHGTYFSVYTNLASVSVKVGQHVTTKQTIGTAGINSDGDNMINFQIWKVGSNNASTTVNPALWLAPLGE